MEKKKISITELIKGKKSIAFLGALFLIGLTLIAFSSGEKEPDHENNNFSEQEYIDFLENKLENVIAKIDGVGSVKVMVTLDSGTKNLYAKDVTDSLDIAGENKSYDSSSSLTYKSSSSSSREPVSIGEKYPAVRGVAVVCTGASEPSVKEKVIELVKCVLNVTSNRVCVTN